MAFGGYWKLFMDGNSLDIGFLRLLIPVNQLVPNVYSSNTWTNSRFSRFSLYGFYGPLRSFAILQTGFFYRLA
jgi:hypothetical protein